MTYSVFAKMLRKAMSFALVLLSMHAKAQGVVTGSGTPGKAPVWTDVTTIGDSAITQGGTNVGIGTDTPLFALDVSALIMASGHPSNRYPMSKCLTD